MAARSPQQRAVAVVAGDVPTDVPAGPGRKHEVTEYVGLKASDMTEAQRRLLRVLVEEYVRNSDFDVAEAQLDAIAAVGWGELWFSWRGATEDLAEPFFYRVHGPRILIELTQRLGDHAGAQGVVMPDHVHTIVRGPANDYGELWLEQSFTERFTSRDRFDAAIAREHDADR